MVKKKQSKNPYPYGFDHTTGDGQKRLMAISIGQDSERWITRPMVDLGEDYGADPLGNGKFKMVPSGDVVDYEERVKRLLKYERKER